MSSGDLLNPPKTEKTTEREKERERGMVHNLAKQGAQAVNILVAGFAFGDKVWELPTRHRV